MPVQIADEDHDSGPHDGHCPLAYAIDKREAERLNVAALREAACESVQFRGAMETANMLPLRLPQPVQQSFRSRSSSLAIAPVSSMVSPIPPPPAIPRRPVGVQAQPCPAPGHGVSPARCSACARKPSTVPWAPGCSSSSSLPPMWRNKCGCSSMPGLALGMDRGDHGRAVGAAALHERLLHAVRLEQARREEYLGRGTRQLAGVRHADRWSWSGRRGEKR
jgi:hypothetical protein